MVDFANVTQTIKRQAGLAARKDASAAEERLFERDVKLKYVQMSLYGATFMLAGAYNLMPAFLTGTDAIGAAVGLSPVVFGGIMAVSMLAFAAYSTYQFFKEDTKLRKELADPSPGLSYTSVAIDTQENKNNKDHIKQQSIAAACIALSIVLGMLTIPIPFVGPLLSMGLMSYGLNKYLNTSLKSYAIANSNQVLSDNNLGNQERHLKKVRTELGYGLIPTTAFTVVLILLAVGTIAFPPAIPAVFVIGAAATMGVMLFAQVATMAKIQINLQNLLQQKHTPTAQASTNNTTAINTNDIRRSVTPPIPPTTRRQSASSSATPSNSQGGGTSHNPSPLMVSSAARQGGGGASRATFTTQESKNSNDPKDSTRPGGR